jgi:hypothetical protein
MDSNFCNLYTLIYKLKITWSNVSLSTLKDLIWLSNENNFVNKKFVSELRD